MEWLGNVPAHWTVERLKSSIEEVVELGTERQANDLYVALDRVESWTGRIKRTDTGFPADSQLKRFRAGDVLFGKLRPYLAKVARPISDGLCVGEFLVLRPRGRAYARGYLEQLLRSKPVIDAIDSSTFGARMPRADWNFIGCMLVVRPPHEEQSAIARFLNDATERIERYIRAREKLIALLEEQKQVLVHDAVTGRIDIRTGEPYPAYKPSGVEWLGDIPSHWDVRRAKRVFRPRNEYARPGDTQLSATQAYGVIAQARYEEKIGRKVTKILRHLDKRRHVEVNDFVISMRSFQGGLERAWESGCIRSSYIVLRPAKKVNVDYFTHLFKTCGYIAALQMTANFIRDGQDLNYNNFCGVDLPFPPRSEQREIAEALVRRTENTRLSIKRFRREIELAREYRTRLIADVVTGKLDVRDAAKSPSGTLRGHAGGKGVVGQGQMT